MKFDISAELKYDVISPSTLILNIHALRSPHQTIISEEFIVEPHVKVEELTSEHAENRFVRLEILKPASIAISYKATVDNHCKVYDQKRQREVSVGQLDTSIFPYLYPSRYCQSDKFYRMANNKFGEIKNPFSKVLALSDWIFETVEYLSGSTNSETSAYDTVTEQAGVCRDFAHLGIALCRALTIPARYFTCYAYQLSPPDFHACFEAYLGGQWILFDPTRLVALNGLVKIATGRDAADTAIASIFGDVQCTSIQVGCELADKTFKPFTYEGAPMKGILYK